MNGFDILDAQIRAMFTDLRYYWHRWVWDDNKVRIPLLLLVAGVSLLYWVTSLFYITTHLYTSPQHLISLVFIFAGSLGVFVWSIGHLRRRK